MSGDHGALTAQERKELRMRGKIERTRESREDQVSTLEPITVEAPPPAIPSEPRPEPRPEPARIERPAVPDGFAFNDRSRLRAQALSFALDAARHMGARFQSGEELLSQAEEIERWIAGAR